MAKGIKVVIFLVPDEYKYVLEQIRAEGMGKSEYFRGLINRARRTPKFRPDKIFREREVRLTPEERKTLETKYGIKIYRRGII